MATPSSPERSDGFISLLNGMHGGLDPLNLGDGFYHKGVNVTSRTGIIGTRPSYTKLFQLQSGKFQGASVWSLNSGDRVVYVSAGKLHSLRLNTLSSVDHGQLFSVIPNRCAFCQAYSWMLVSDATSVTKALEEDAAGTAVVYSRAGTYADTNAPPEDVRIPPFHAAAYVHGRVHFIPDVLPAMLPALDDSDPSSVNAVLEETALTGQTSLTSSDPVDLFVPEFMFRMTEHRVDNEGGSLTPPLEIGFLCALSSFRNAATGTGVGPLVAIGRNGVVAFDVSIPRGNWKDSSISQVLFAGSGTQSPNGVVYLNDDILFLDTDWNLRSVRFTKSQVGSGSGSLSNTPLSFELTPFSIHNARAALPSASISDSDNRLFFTFASSEDGVYPALAVLDFAKVYGVTGADKPSFDGIWTGFKFLQTLSARIDDSRVSLAIVQRESDNTIWLYKLDEDAIFDDVNSRIESKLFTKFYNFQALMDTKKFKYAELWASDIKTTTTFKIYFRARGYPYWTLISEKVAYVPGGLPQYRRRMAFEFDTDALGQDAVTQEKLWVGAEFQFAIVWTGRAKIDKFRCVCDLVQEAPPDCSAESSDSDLTYTSGVELDDFSYKAVIT